MLAASRPGLPSSPLQKSLAAPAVGHELGRCGGAVHGERRQYSEELLRRREVALETPGHRRSPGRRSTRFEYLSAPLHCVQEASLLPGQDSLGAGGPRQAPEELLTLDVVHHDLRLKPQVTAEVLEENSLDSFIAVAGARRLVQQRRLSITP